MKTVSWTPLREFEWWYPKIDSENELQSGLWAKRNNYTTKDQKLFEHLNIITRKPEKKTEKDHYRQFTNSIKNSYETSGLEQNLPQDYMVPQIVQDFADALYLGYKLHREHAGDASLFE